MINLTRWTTAVFVTLVLAGAASAQTVTVQQPLMTGTSSAVDNFQTPGQTVLVPAGAIRLESFTLFQQQTVTPVVRAYDSGTNTIGPVLFTGTPYNNPAGTNVTTIIPGGLAVTPGTRIFIGVTQPAPGDVGAVGVANSNAYADGQHVTLGNGVTLLFPGFDLFFTANFAAAPSAVPTLSEWAMILFGLLLAGGAAVLVHRRRTANRLPA